MHTNKKVLLIIAILASSMVIAHEFWMAPSRYLVKKNEVFRFNCYAGEDFKEAIWAKRKERTLQVFKYHLSDKKDITSAFKDKDSIAIRMQIPEAGNHLIALRSIPSYIELDPSMFKTYLLEDGMINIVDYRKKSGFENKRSREFYQRCAKSLLMVDGVQDSSYKINTGMPLEIIPLQNPYAVKIKNSLDVFVSFMGKPLANYQLRSWCKKDGKLVVKAFHKTNAKGIGKIPISTAGEWMISLVKMELHTTSKKADYDSYWGSYTFLK
jgi:uncharacterized GH25 family protein